MFGWTGTFLHIDLTKRKAVPEKYDEALTLNFLGGRGFAVKILWDTLKQGTEPLSPENKLIFATGPLTAIGLPNSGKLVVASKSPLTGGYGDGNMGTLAAVHMRRAGYDALIIEGKAQTPVILHIKDKVCEFVDAKDFWGLNSFETHEQLEIFAQCGHRLHWPSWREPSQVCDRCFTRGTCGRATRNGRCHGLQKFEGHSD
jgi:aldehyde:ferredoxin oxidoreductase